MTRRILSLTQHWAPYASLATALMWSADKVSLDGAAECALAGLGPAVRTPVAKRVADGADAEEPVTTGEKKRKRHGGGRS